MIEKTLNFNKLKNIESIEKDYVHLKDGRKIHTDGFTFFNIFRTQAELENFDKKILYLFFNEK